ncbi:Bug family tripartite tricarboxylate transporter substrate binding protein [Rhodoferax sediminis]|uniref:Tripartite tricarboxylate transporter substrate binding protein n=1 Tax=Rhodoferax sediminis TaxID=2509614 RepID=A0A515DDU6_9BURK|nr:tripartite tricarboxylate transporter substrate binding protein [Rhodoferax sediminis]QDL38586.1 tripartite tricarboxylate transporter substrate binding protein [Rhodoferax sediminis]
MKHRFIHSLLALGIALATSAAVAADAFPSHPIRIVVNTAPGGLTDITTRLVAQKMSENLGQSVIVENRAGGDGLIGIRAVKQARADGYTLLGTASTIAIQPAVKLDPGYDLLKDFTGVGPMSQSPLLIVEATSQSDKTLGDLMARVKANPNKLTYASAGVGTTTHLAAALFLQESGLKMMHVPYKGNGAAFPDVLSGRVTIIFDAYGSSAAQVKGGKLRALAVTSKKRLSAMPEMPTVAEQGIPNYSYELWLGIVAPAGTPKDVVQRLSQALHSATSSKEVQERLHEWGSEPMQQTPEEFTQLLRADLARYSKLVADLSIPKQ